MHFGGLGGVQHQRTCDQAVKPSPDAGCKAGPMLCMLTWQGRVLSSLEMQLNLCLLF